MQAGGEGVRKRFQIYWFRRTAGVTKREELSEQKAAFLERTGQELKDSIKIFNDNDEHTKQQVKILTARDRGIIFR